MMPHDDRTDAKPEPAQPALSETPESAAVDDLHHFGLVSKPHPPDHERRHDHPLAPGRHFTPDPEHLPTDIA